jgi:hypothetical protein
VILGHTVEDALDDGLVTLESNASRVQRTTGFDWTIPI